jgi:hypothetical protein
MNKVWTIILIAASMLAAAPLALAQNEGQGHGEAVVTVLPKQQNAPPSDISAQSVQVQVDGKQSHVSSWVPAGREHGTVELVLLIDGGARASLGREWSDITSFVRGLPPNVKFAVGYMENGRAVLPGPLTENHAQALQGLHLPMGEPGISASPYFCLSDLAKHWPSTDRSARREVIMITDGVDNYERRYNPDDPYVQTAMHDSARAHLVVYSIYWHSAGRFNSSGYETNAGQNLLLELTQSTGGNSYWLGFGNPVTLQPYFEDFSRRLNNQYELGFTAPLHGKPQVESIRVKVNAPDVKVTAPQQASVVPAGTSSE